MPSSALAFVLNFEDGLGSNSSVPAYEVDGLKVTFSGAHFTNIAPITYSGAVTIQQDSYRTVPDEYIAYRPIEIVFSAQVFEVGVWTFVPSYGSMRATMSAYGDDGTLLGATISEPYRNGVPIPDQFQFLSVTSVGIKKVVLGGALAFNFNGNSPAFDNLTIVPSPVPEPSVIALMALGAAMLGPLVGGRTSRRRDVRSGH